MRQERAPRIKSLKKDEVVELATRRFTRFLRLQRDYGSQLNERGLLFLRLGIFSAYMDLRELGLQDQAPMIIHGVENEVVQNSSSDLITTK